MGKTTKAQKDAESRGEAKPRPVTTAVESGVYITRQDDNKVQAFKGTFEAQLTPGGDVAVIEMVPDVGNTNEGKPIAVIRQFINHAVWAEVILK